MSKITGTNRVILCEAEVLRLLQRAINLEMTPAHAKKLLSICERSRGLGATEFEIKYEALPGDGDEASAGTGRENPGGSRSAGVGAPGDGCYRADQVP